MGDKRRLLQLVPKSHMLGHRPPDKSAYWKIIFFISHPKHMLWVLNETVLLSTQNTCINLWVRK